MIFQVAILNLNFFLKQKGCVHSLGSCIVSIQSIAFSYQASTAKQHDADADQVIWVNVQHQMWTSYR